MGVFVNYFQKWVVLIFIFISGCTLYFSSKMGGSSSGKVTSGCPFLLCSKMGGLRIFMQKWVALLQKKSKMGVHFSYVQKWVVFELRFNYG